MKLLDKFKNMFTEEVEEEPVKKEVMQVEIPAPAVIADPKPVSENETLIKEEKTPAPVFFDDNDFAKIEKPREEIKPKKIEEKYYKKDVEEKKVFRPTPIISPVYGVLDKNYHKEDISNKKKSVNLSRPEKPAVTVDDIRNKAFGDSLTELDTLMENDFSQTLEPISSVDEMNKGANILDDLMDIDYQPRHEQKTDDILNMLGDSQEDIPSEKESEASSLSDSDLFNLIDSMYEKGDAE